MKVGLGEQPGATLAPGTRHTDVGRIAARAARFFMFHRPPLLVVGRRPRLSKTLLLVGKADLRGDVLGSEERKGVVKDNMIRAGLR